MPSLRSEFILGISPSLLRRQPSSATSRWQYLTERDIKARRILAANHHEIRRVPDRGIVKIPPIHLELIDLRTTAHLVAFVEYGKLGIVDVPESPFFLGFYVKPGKATTGYLLLLVDESGLRQRRLTEAGDCIEYAVIVATGMFPNVTVLDVMAFQNVCNERLFSGHLSR